MCPAHAVLDQRQSSELSVHPSISNHHMKPVETPAEQTATTSSGIQNSFDSSTRETSAILPTTNTTVLRNGKVDSLRVSNCASSNTSPLQPSEIQNGDFQYSSLHNKNTCHDQNSNPLSKRDSSYNNANTIAGDHNSAGGTHHDDSQISSGKDTACSYNTTHSDSSSTDTAPYDNPIAALHYSSKEEEENEEGSLNNSGTSIQRNISHEINCENSAYNLSRQEPIPISTASSYSTTQNSISLLKTKPPQLDHRIYQIPSLTPQSAYVQATPLAVSMGNTHLPPTTMYAVSGFSSSMGSLPRMPSPKQQPVRRQRQSVSATPYYIATNGRCTNPACACQGHVIQPSTVIRVPTSIREGRRPQSLATGNATFHGLAPSNVAVHANTAYLSSQRTPQTTSTQSIISQSTVSKPANVTSSSSSSSCTSSVNPAGPDDSTPITNTGTISIRSQHASHHQFRRGTPAARSYQTSYPHTLYRQQASSGAQPITVHGQGPSSRVPSDTTISSSVPLPSTAYNHSPTSGPVSIPAIPASLRATDRNHFQHNRVTKTTNHMRRFSQTSTSVVTSDANTQKYGLGQRSSSVPPTTISSISDFLPVFSDEDLSMVSRDNSRTAAEVLADLARAEPNGTIHGNSYNRTDLNPSRGCQHHLAKHQQQSSPLSQSQMYNVQSNVNGVSGTSTTTLPPKVSPHYSQQHPHHRYHNSTAVSNDSTSHPNQTAPPPYVYRYGQTSNHQTYFGYISSLNRAREGKNGQQQRRRGAYTCQGVQENQASLETYHKSLHMKLSLQQYHLFQLKHITNKSGTIKHCPSSASLRELKEYAKLSVQPSLQNSDVGVSKKAKCRLTKKSLVYLNEADPEVTDDSDSEVEEEPLSMEETAWRYDCADASYRMRWLALKLQQGKQLLKECDEGLRTLTSKKRQALRSALDEIDDLERKKLGSNKHGTPTPPQNQAVDAYLDQPQDKPEPVSSTASAHLMQISQRCKPIMIKRPSHFVNPGPFGHINSNPARAKTVPDVSMEGVRAFSVSTDKSFHSMLSFITDASHHVLRHVDRVRKKLIKNKPHLSSLELKPLRQKPRPVATSGVSIERVKDRKLPLSPPAPLARRGSADSVSQQSSASIPLSPLESTSTSRTGSPRKFSGKGSGKRKQRSCFEECSSPNQSTGNGNLAARNSSGDKTPRKSRAKSSTTRASIPVKHGGHPDAPTGPAGNSSASRRVARSTDSDSGSKVDSGQDTCKSKRPKLGKGKQSVTLSSDTISSLGFSSPTLPPAVVPSSPNKDA